MSNVIALHSLNPERLAALRGFYADLASFYMQQARRPEGGAAALHIAITGKAQVEHRMCAIDAEHAAVLLTELDQVRAKLCEILAENGPSMAFNGDAAAKSATNVVPLHR